MLSIAAEVVTGSNFRTPCCDKPFSGCWYHCACLGNQSGCTCDGMTKKAESQLVEHRLLAYWSSILSTWVLDWDAKLSYFTSYLDRIYFLLRTFYFWTPLSTRWGLRYSTRSTDPLRCFPMKLLEHFLLYLEFFYPDRSFTFPLNTELAVRLHISLTIRYFDFLWTETKLLAHCLRTSP